MPDIDCFAFVEDAPGAAVLRKLAESRNTQSGNRLLFHKGFPKVMGGYHSIRSRCEAFLNMAKAGIRTVILTDLYAAECACCLIRDWFAIPQGESADLPSQCIFRVAVREVESWILADHAAWAEYIEIPEANFSRQPELLEKPKEHLLDVIRRKGTTKRHREMLPKGTAHIGPRYNEVLCDFVNSSWVPERAAESSPSLDRALNAVMNI